ncbi:MAG: reverse transcriptase domain-containing protein [Aeromonas veronii]
MSWTQGPGLEFTTFSHFASGWQCSGSGRTLCSASHSHCHPAEADSSSGRSAVRGESLSSALLPHSRHVCIHPQDWFAAIDLKDAYFHVSILPRHRPFLRIAFEGRAYQYKVLPFGLSLSPRVFTKVAEVAIVPLKEQGARILNFLDNWLILA